MGVEDSGGCISATRHGTALFEYSKRIYMIASTRRTKRHVHAISIFCHGVLGNVEE